MSITEFALKRPVTTMVIFTCCAAIGVIASRLLPLAFLPDIEFPYISVQVPYQGSSPEEVERLITKPIEESLSTLGGIKRMQSYSDANQVQIFLELNWGENPSVKEIQVLDKLDGIRDQLPADVRHINVNRQSAAEIPILQIRLSSNRNLSHSYQMLNRAVKARLQRVNGVSHVELYGVEPTEVHINLHAEAIAAHHVDLARLNAMLLSSNFSLGGGTITDGNMRLLVQINGQFKSLDDIRNLLVEPNLRLGDIADVMLASPERNYGRHLDGHYAIGLDIYKETGANMVEVAQRVVREVDAIGKLPEMQGINIFYISNTANGVKQSLGSVLEAGLFGALLSLIVLYYFLRQISTTLMVTLAVPFSLLIALAVMYFMGLSLNIFSMMGLMLAIGMLIDNAVVVVENIFRHRKLNPGKPVAAAISGTREVALAVTTGTLTTIIVFLPNLFGAQNEITVYLKHVAVTIVVSLIASLFISLTLMPMLSSRIPPPGERRRKGTVESLTGKYEALLGWTLLHRWIMIGVIVLVIVTAAIPVALVKKDMFSNSDPVRLVLNYNLNGHYALETVETAVSKVEAYLFAHKQEFEYKSIYSYFDNGEAQTTILLRDDPPRHKTAAQLKEQIRKGLPGIAIGKLGFDDQDGGNGSIQLQLSGESTTVLEGLADSVTRALEHIPGLVDVRADALTGTREIHLYVNPERARRAGLDASQVASAVMVVLRGEQLSRFRDKDGEIDIRLAYRKSDRQTLDQLRNLQLYNSQGQPIRLDAVADFSVSDGPSSIEHQNRSTSISVNIGLAPDHTFDEMRPLIKGALDNLAFPPGYQWQFGQGVQEQDESAQTMVTNMLLAVLMIYIVMAALFESLLHPAAILSGILFSIFGVFWFFLITRTTFDIMAMIGILILMGVVVNNGIVMVDHINQLRREGWSRFAAVVQGSSHRLRPILMTMATAILGLVPLAVGNTQLGGEGQGPAYFPMARAIIGGLAFSTAVSLLVLPTIYVLLDDLGMWSVRVLREARGLPAAAQTTQAAGE